MNNREYAEKDLHFHECCANAELVLQEKNPKFKLPPTSRQASKFRMGRGCAYKYGRETKETK